MDEQKRADHLTRQQMQNEAMIIRSLLDSVAALHNTGDHEQAIGLVHLAHDHAERLDKALDFVNAPKGTE
ncbi:hypothetical protein J3R80_05870 [Aliiroseovarius sp. Z3]|uniref:hypothetical protein n=1 Tax=Aliiroseovarius sp. Z3 TaxID=2811402 RepID=UPI0023B29596|nr:hypothetical protein [Aliiroseovarius sp. Z3]MDE9449994.1 hypothetical protein [Aliiroseovarius sp. Z3]